MNRGKSPVATPLYESAYSERRLPELAELITNLASGFFSCCAWTKHTTSAALRAAAFSVGPGIDAASSAARLWFGSGVPSDITHNATLTISPLIVSNARGPSRATKFHSEVLNRRVRNSL